MALNPQVYASAQDDGHYLGIMPVLCQPNSEGPPQMYPFPIQVAINHLLCAGSVLGTEDASVCGTQESVFQRSVFFPVQLAASLSIRHPLPVPDL